MKLLNLASGRELREGDEIRLKTGPRAGRLGKVVGVDLFSDSPVVVQFPKAINGVVREWVDSDNVDVVRFDIPDSLEPLPDRQEMLTEVAPVFMTCGLMLCLTLNEDGTVLTCVPRDNSVRLRKIFESNYKKSVRSAVSEVMKKSFVTRTPHLVKFGKSSEIEALLTAPDFNPYAAIGQLLGTPHNGKVS